MLSSSAAYEALHINANITVEAAAVRSVIFLFKNNTINLPQSHIQDFLSAPSAPVASRTISLVLAAEVAKARKSKTRAGISKGDTYPFSWKKSYIF
jgi:hypothetical protein